MTKRDQVLYVVALALGQARQLICDSYEVVDIQVESRVSGG